MKTNLKRIRESQGKLQEEVAKDLGIALSTYRSWEQGSRNLNGTKLSRLADYYGVSVDTILATNYGVSFDEQTLTESEETLLNLFNKLDDKGKEKLLEYADDLINSGKYIKSEVHDHSIQQAVSA